ncbi:hypothetical protein CCP3SC1AL1_320008 [Gammaproteobacteria bacterium]
MTLFCALWLSVVSSKLFSTATKVKAQLSAQDSSFSLSKNLFYTEVL